MDNLCNISPKNNTR